MTKREFDSLLGELKLSQSEAARLLSVDARTFRRWVEDPAAMPGPAEQALKAWLTLHRHCLPWAPGSIDFVEQDPRQIAEHRAHSIGLEALLKKVEQRGGPAAPWEIDFERCYATLGPMQVSFYRLPNGGFSPQSYQRSDLPADLHRDWPLIEDAFAHISRAIARQRGKLKNK